jgi:hypothetical protein
MHLVSFILAGVILSSLVPSFSSIHPLQKHHYNWALYYFIVMYFWNFGNLKYLLMVPVTFNKTEISMHVHMSTENI